MKKILIVFIVLAAFITIALPVSAALPDDLVGWWKFEGDADDETEINNGTEVGTNSYTTGQVGQAISLNGNGYVFAPYSGLNEEEGTFELWVYPQDLSIKPQAFMEINTDAGQPNNYQIQYWTNGKLYFRINKLGQEISVDAISAGFTEGDWNHLAMTWNTSGMKAYVNGTEYTNATAFTFPNDMSGNLFIGAWHDGTRKSHALIDEVRIWKIALTEEDLGYYDYDLDGVNDESGEDLCPDTWPDEMVLGTNRWKWNGINWETEENKGNGKGPEFDPTMDNTQGCSCKQILDRMSDTTGLDFGGHYKYGCSKSILEDWIEGEYFIETVEVPANDVDGVESLMPLVFETDYILKAYGTAFAGDNIEFDAKYSFRTGSSTGWTDTVSTYEYLGPELLDLYVDATNIDWGGYNPDNIYWYNYTGTGSVVEFWIYDTYPVNNEGSLFVDIIAKLW